MTLEDSTYYCTLSLSLRLEESNEIKVFSELFFQVLFYCFFQQALAAYFSVDTN